MDGHADFLFVQQADQIMLVTDGGQLIRCPVEGIGVKGRSTQGVNVFTTSEGERVVSVERISDEGLDGQDNGEGPEDLGPSDGE